MGFERTWQGDVLVVFGQHLAVCRDRFQGVTKRLFGGVTGGKTTRWHSIRINGQFRVCFVWRGVDATDVEIVDYH